MTVSAARTIVVPVAVPTPWAPYLIGPPLQWTQQKQPDEVLDYSLDLTAPLADIAVSVSSITASMAPSNGPGVSPAPGNDAQPTSLNLSGSVVTLIVAGGVPGRTSTAKVTVQSAGTDVLEYVVQLVISPLQGTWPLPAPTSASFGAALQVAVMNTANDQAMGDAAGAPVTVNPQG